MGTIRRTTGKEQAESDQQNFPDETEEEAARHAFQDPWQEPHGSIETEDPKQALDETSEPAGRVRTRESHREK